MAYDLELADRIRELGATESGPTEQRMFGRLAVLLDGNMAVVASDQGGLMCGLIQRTPTSCWVPPARVAWR